MTNVDAYVFFHRNCAEAMRFYEKTLNGKLRILTAKEAPGADKLPPDQADLVMHAHLDVGGGALMASDWMSPGLYPACTASASRCRIRRPPRQAASSTHSPPAARSSCRSRRRSGRRASAC